MSPDLAAKRLQLLKEATPRAQRIGVIGCSGNAVHDAQWSAIQPAAQQMGLRLIPIFFQRPEELNPLFEMALRKEKMDAILILDCSALTSPERVVELVSKARVPALYPFPRFVQAGGLISYGPNVEKQYRRAAIFVDKILRGANPGDIPVEQPTTIDLIVNVKAARMLNIKFPPSFLGRADQLIE
jgi:putative ABC transport system substrate-binding protein